MRGNIVWTWIVKTYSNNNIDNLCKNEEKEVFQSVANRISLKISYINITIAQDSDCG